MSTVSNVRKTRSQCATRSHVSRIPVPAAASRAHPVPIPSYVTLPVSSTAQDAPVPHLVDPPRRSPITPPAPQVTIPADAVIGGPVGAAPESSTQTSPVGGPLIEVFRMISSLMTEVSELRGTVTAIEAEQSSVKEQYEALRASYLDLEEIMLREIADPEESSDKKKKIKKKKSTPLNGDARRHASRFKDVPDHPSSEEDDTSEEEDNSDSESMGPAVPGLTEQQTRRPEFAKLVSYRAYRLNNRSQKVNPTVSGNVNAQLKRLKHHIDGKFTGDPAIQVLDFLGSFKTAADQNQISEASAALLLPYFLEGRAKTGLASRMKQIPSLMPRYPAAVHWLLQSYATEPTISAACQRVITARQKIDEDEEQFAARLTRYAADAGSVFSEDALITAYVDGLLPFASNTVRGHVSATMTFAEVQLLAEQAGKASRALAGVKAGIRPLNAGLSSVRPRPIVAAAADSYRRDAEMYSDRGPVQAIPEGLVATLEYPYDGEVPEHSDSISTSSGPSAVSIPSRGWTSVAGSRCTAPAGVDAANAVDFRPRSCHLCFDPSHFIMDCPLIGNETRKLAQESRESKLQDTSTPREPGKPPSTLPAKRMPPRPMGLPRQWEPRRPPIAVNTVLPPPSEPDVVPVQVVNDHVSENESRDA
jgi:hypothetical protein